MRITALAAGLVLLPASVLQANADVLYSLTGVVGDSNWIPADPLYFGPGAFELFRDVSSVFQVNGGPGGLITVNFGGPDIEYSRDKILSEVFSLTATCTNPTGCYTCTDICDLPGFSIIEFDGGHPEDCCLTYPIDSNYYVQDLVTPPFAPYGSTFFGYRMGNIGYWADEIVGPDAVGQPFSLTVDTVAMPEPLTLSLFGAGFAGVMAMRRRRKA